ncbi:MAG: hypothetical protein CL870_03980 [Cytophagia bacterium]|nr:hypothetical protein [Cytophagia bacterium]
MAKNRRTIISEVFKALSDLDEIDYNEEELWGFFNSCVDKRTLKKLSKERDSASDGTSSVKTRGKTGYQHFLSEFSEPIPEGMGKREFKGAAWKALSKEEQEEWNQKVAEINLANGFIKKPQTSDVENEATKWKEDWTQWSNKDPDTRGPEPVRRVPLGPHILGSKFGKPSTTDKLPSPTEESKADYNSQSIHLSQATMSDIEDITQKLASLKLKDDTSESDSDSDSDSESDPDSDSGNNDTTDRIEWLKTAYPPKDNKWIKNVSSNFRAWLMFEKSNKFGPDKDNTISTSEWKNLKEEHNYETLKKDIEAPWHDFLLKNAIIV